MSTHATVAPTGPTSAEHARTVLARAISLSLTTAGQGYDVEFTDIAPTAVLNRVRAGVTVSRRTVRSR
ncbi:hypothetical protein [Streptomyces sp. A012304]|uniref:hypothetical protein n=1 Tax=Streptomyces sp. A012304 TaxID=375446 RepID=UPI002232A9B1|nr:hypothetical protein [Streptomyces sp. A012304]GKQ35997.1 hypothetical protein ALMP_25400 [Streptomyces sp. A012304]